MRVSSQIYSIIVDLLKANISPYSNAIIEDANAILESSGGSLEMASTREEDGMDIDIEWQIPYHALMAISKVLQACPELTTQTEANNTIMVSLSLARLLFETSPNLKLKLVENQRHQLCMI